MKTLTRHPARYTDALLPIFAQIIPTYSRGLDPFGGTGKIFEIERYVEGVEIECVEIEPEWAAYDNRITVGDALALPWGDGYFDWICTSPTYGNRMADHHEARDCSRRNTYRHALNRPLHPANAGQLQYGAEYQKLHRSAWAEAWRVLRPGGLFVLNIKDHIRRGERVNVTQFHEEALRSVGFTWLGSEQVKCPGNRFGQNGGESSGEVFWNIPALQAGVLVRFQRARLRHLRPTPKTASVLFFSTIIYTTCYVL